MRHGAQRTPRSWRLTPPYTAGAWGDSLWRAKGRQVVSAARDRERNPLRRKALPL